MALRGRRLEELAKAYPVAVFTAFRSRKPKVMTGLADSDHFLNLLGAEPP